MKAGASRPGRAANGTTSATGLKKTIANLNQFPPVASQAVTTEIQSLFTATARLGFLATPQWLLYIKGGYAGGEIETSGTTTPHGIPRAQEHHRRRRL